MAENVSSSSVVGQKTDGVYGRLKKVVIPGLVAAAAVGAPVGGDSFTPNSARSLHAAEARTTTSIEKNDNPILSELINAEDPKNSVVDPKHKTILEANLKYLAAQSKPNLDRAYADYLKYLKTLELPKDVFDTYVTSNIRRSSGALHGIHKLKESGMDKQSLINKANALAAQLIAESR
jgi:hypothetical protein